MFPVRTGQESIVSVRIETGRKHQIRRHLAELGHPVVGDRLYGDGAGGEGGEGGADLQLVAVYLGLECPESGQWVQFSLPRSHCLADIDRPD